MLRWPFATFAAFALTMLLAAPTVASAAYAGALLRALPTAAETNMPAYSRVRFKHWTDADSNGCDARHDVLYRQNTARNADGCSAATGRWKSLYDNLVFTEASKLDVDHFIPLAQAWRSGALKWDDATRERFANDLAYRPSLLAVSAASNRAKGDKDPALWTPPVAAFHCRYAVTWVSVKYRWRLTVDTAERTALRRLLTGCPAKVIKIVTPPRAVITTGGSTGGSAAPAGTGGSGGSTPLAGGTRYPLQPDRPGDQDCSDFSGPVRVLPGDPDHLDRDGDGIGCE